MSRVEVVQEEIELSTKECVEVAQYMYQQWQEAMKPPLYSYHDFPTWLNILERGFINGVKDSE